MQYGIKSAGAQTIAVPRQLFDHLQPKDRLLRCVIKHMQPNQAGVKLAMIGFSGCQ
jgi:hypothetical protein